MKIRLYKDSVRLRLSPGEVEVLAKGEKVTEAFQWGDIVELNFELIPDDSITLNVTPNRSTWQITWQKEKLLEWSESEEVGIYHDFANKGTKHIKVSIEKDFACVGREGEDKKDRFPNPNAKAC